jgi:hypothetical protein
VTGESPATSELASAERVAALVEILEISASSLRRK